MMAFFADMRVTPRDKIIERTAGNPSGTEETAKEMIHEVASSNVNSR